MAYWGSPCQECPNPWCTVNSCMVYGVPDVDHPTETGPNTCISPLFGDEVPIHGIMVISGEYSQVSCSDICLDDATNYPLNHGAWNGCYTRCYADWKWEAWAAGGGTYRWLVRGWNNSCNGGEYFLAIVEGGSGDPSGGEIVRYKGYQELPSVSSASFSGEWFINSQYFVMDHMPADGRPEFGTEGWPSTLGSSAWGGPCEWHSCCKESEWKIIDWDDQLGDYIYDCVAKAPFDCVDLKECDCEYVEACRVESGYGPEYPCWVSKFCSTTPETLGVRYRYATNYSWYASAQSVPSSCQHGIACSGGLLDLGEGSSSMGVCCINVSFSGVQWRSRDCYMGLMETDTPNLTVNYHHVGSVVNPTGLLFEAEPWGCMVPFPTNLGISLDAGQRTAEDCGNAKVTITVYGYRVDLKENGELLGRSLVFSGEKGDFPSTQYGDPRRITPGQLSSIDVTYNDADSTCDDATTVDFSGATATLTFNADTQWSDCQNPIGENPFANVQRWDVEISPAEHHRLSYEEQYYNEDGQSQIQSFNASFSDGSYWPMYDSYNPPVEFEFNSTGGVGTYYRGSGPNNDAGTVNRISVGFDEDSPSATLNYVKTAINSRSGEDFFTRAWANGDEESLTSIIQSLNPENYQWFSGEIPRGLLLLTSVDSTTGYLFPAGWMQIVNTFYAVSRYFEIDDERYSLNQEGSAIVLNDGTNDPTRFEFDKDGEVTDGSVRVVMSVSQRTTAQNFVDAVNNAANLDISAEYPEDEPELCEDIIVSLYKDEEKFGEILFSADLFDWNESTHVATFRVDKIGAPGLQWHTRCGYTTVWAAPHSSRRNAWVASLVHNACTVGDARYAFCAPGNSTPSRMQCTINDPHETCALAHGSKFAMTPC